MIKLIIFDLDGTLVDSLPDLTDAVNYMRSKFALQELSLEEVRKRVGEGAGRLVEQSLPGFDREAQHQGLQHFIDFNFRHIADKSAFYPKVPETLQSLQERGYILTIASNKSEPLCREILRVLGADQFFDAILGAESAASRKPSPAPVLHLMQMFDVGSHETVMVGDSGYDIAAGKGAEVLTIGCDYGYGAPEELAAADRIVSSIEAIITIVAGYHLENSGPT